MSFQQGLSGLNLSAKQLDVIGHNVANASTVGFKQSQAQFSDMYAASLSGSGAVQIGTGGKVSAVVQQFTQGNVTNTNNPLDTAISGQGFFRMVEQNGSVLYSRNGQFQVDKNGYIVNNQGHKLSGYLPDATGLIIPGQPLPIQISSADLAPKQTANAVVGANLDSRAATPVNSTFNTLDPTSYNSSTSTTVYDSLGASHVGSLYFQRLPMDVASLGNGSIAAGSSAMTLTGSTAGLSAGKTVTLAGVTYTITSVDSTTQLTVSPTGPLGGASGAFTATNAPSANWNTYLAIDGALVPAAGTAMATLTFDTLGQLSSTTPASVPLGTLVSAAFTPTGAAVQTLSFNFAQTSQYGGNFGVNSLTQDGYASGRLSGFNTSADGTILGRYSNGQSRALGQVLLANFTNPQGLQPMGNNEWVESSTSGGPLIGTPGSSALGVLQSSAVEDSNVDLTAELVSMITAQRVYQANAQTIKAQDQVLQTLVNLR
ncbi:MAG: flagellar hook protein FlgE [Gallionella sp.]|nr:flagellar hook protein FlgE [Gallionella sp.]